MFLPLSHFNIDSLPKELFERLKLQKKDQQVSFTWIPYAKMTSTLSEEEVKCLNTLQETIGTETKSHPDYALFLFDEREHYYFMYECLFKG
jgi:hypothetical protein